MGGSVGKNQLFSILLNIVSLDFFHILHNDIKKHIANAVKVLMMSSLPLEHAQTSPGLPKITQNHIEHYDNSYVLYIKFIHSNEVDVISY